MVGFMFSQQPWKTNVMLPITHTGAARGHRESSRTRFFCSHPDLVEKAKKSALKQSRRKMWDSSQKQDPVLWPRMDPGQSSAPVPSQDSAETEAPPVLRGSSSSENSDLLQPPIPFSLPTEIPPEKRKGEKKLRKERGAESRTEQYVVFPLSSTGKTHAVGKSSVSRLVSAHEQAVPPAGGCCVIPQGTTQSSLAQAVPYQPHKIPRVLPLQKRLVAKKEGGEGGMWVQSWGRRRMRHPLWYSHL